MDFDIEIDFDMDDLEIDDDFILNTKSKKRIFFDLQKSFKLLSENLKLPKKTEDLRLISPAGGWSSCSLVMFIANQEKIVDLFITTLRVGIKEAKQLELLYNNKRIENITIILGSIAKENGTYKYEEKLSDIFNQKKVVLKYINNHSKVILAKTEKNYYVIETSSNFNENPKIEQFIISNDKKIYDYYVKAFTKLRIL